MDILELFVKSPEMRDFYRNNPLNDQQLIELIINAPESISSKQLALRSLLPTRNKETAALINK